MGVDVPQYKTKFRTEQAQKEVLPSLDWQRKKGTVRSLLVRPANGLCVATPDASSHLPTSVEDMEA